LAIYHLSMKPIARSSGRSAVASAAYRAGECLTNERDGLTHDFTRRNGVEHAEIVIPQGVEADWAKDRSSLWNAAELAENRKDARVAREFEIALPHELNSEQRLEATRTFAHGLADRYGAAVDFAIHAPHGETDVRNFHAHVMITVRSIGADGLGDKTLIERENKWLSSRELPTSQMQLREIRQSWEQIANTQLARAGFDERIDHRSHQERGLEIEPTEHMGVHATQMQRRGMEVSRARLDAEAAKRNAELIREKPEQVLTLITGEKSVFDRRDVARALHRYIDDPQAFQNAFAAVMGSKALVELQAEHVDRHGEIAPARYSTREMVAVERGMADSAERMAEGRGHGVEEKHVAAALDAQTQAIRRGVLADAMGKIERGELSASAGQRQINAAGLSDEQRAAAAHVAGPEQIAAVVGFAGAGKSTMLAAARQAWQAQGFTVHGAALSGKAAEGLEESSGIQSRTLASWEHGWTAGRGALGPKDVLVIDEAGMVGSRQLVRFVGEAERAGAKLVLVGDHEQLQAIGAGAPFRAVAEKIGFAELSDIRRQREDWQRGAAQDFARHRTTEGLAAYAARGAVNFSETRESARAEIVRDYMADLDQQPEGSRVAMAHRRVDVRGLNAAIRAARQERGELARGEESGERTFQTNDGLRAFAAGDRIAFLENNRELGVKNGMLGTVTGMEDGRIAARLDGKGRDGAERLVSVSVADYAAIDHGYATTIHKTQGATVDRAFVLASGTMDRHLTYVAMTRHRDGARLYADGQEFKGGMAALSARLSRDGSKETTLDYAQGFSERRGIAERLGVRSEIEARGQVESPARERSADRRDERGQAQGREGERPDPAQAQAAERPVRKRGMFAGLKLDSGRAPVPGEARAAPAGETERGCLLQAAEGYARALADAARMRDLGLPIVEHQKVALQKSGAAARRRRRGGAPRPHPQRAPAKTRGGPPPPPRPGSTRELRAALQHDPATRRALTDSKGPERAARLVAGMERERAAQLDPHVRAARLVGQWNGLEQEHAKLRGWEQTEAREKVEGRMRAVAEAIGRDAPVEAALRERSKAFGIGADSHLGRAIRQEEVGQALEHSLERGLWQRGQGMER
jgi:Ti-type conjugative transfer relaxase TraA